MKYNYLTIALLLMPMSSFSSEVESKDFKFSGNISAVSAYINYGATNDPENDSATLQTTLKFDYKNFYFVYFNSKLGYSFSEIQRDENRYKRAEENVSGRVDLTEEEYAKEVEREYNNLSLTSKRASSFSFYENDFILGYENTYKKLNYDINLKYLYYAESDHTGGIAAEATFKYPLREDKDKIGVSFETYLNDVYFMNKGDTYIEFNYENVLAPSYYLNLYAGFSYFNGNGKYVKGTTEDLIFKHATVEVAHSLDEKEQVFGWMQYIVGGKDRYSENQKNMVVAGLSYNF
ncbi:hypothetical protein [Acinetobacter sp. ANC 4648]|uniref:hypothetical protein n=1 Tax=Acinetobacter sp. ANC 4648 TaxID=1977875 RepID=UPI000A32EE86|nr:hypothetical protein [Acinetobacter sp. ANC 4648]OTG83644.1 hypothetical protein B9T27_03775 [Acinetobacter sp. ANC 4648]